MYVVPPPQRSDPASGSAGASTDSRVYQIWKGSNVSFNLVFAFFLWLFELTSIFEIISVAGYI